MELKVNGRVQRLDAALWDEQAPLLWALRDGLNLTGTKFGCGVAACGACTVLVDGQAQRSCVTPCGSVQGKAITTIEALAPAQGQLHPLQQAWVQHNVPQCGYCQSGMLMAAAALLARNPQPSDADIDAAITNLCRCGTYPRIRLAIRSAAEALRAGRGAGRNAAAASAAAVVAPKPPATPSPQATTASKP
jgi:isoquinoline 1-oxidoreductase subunit alpha